MRASPQPVRRPAMPEGARARAESVDADRAPLALVEPDHAQRGTRRVTDEDRDPDVHRLERGELLDHEADAERDDDLRDDGDVERALGVARALQAAGEGERHRD